MERYTKKIETLKKLDDDQEVYHFERDEILKTFVKDIHLNKFKNKQEIKEISTLIYKNVFKVSVWYS